MNEACRDGWAGRIPGCALSGTAQQQENGNGGAASTGAHDQDSGTMMERDYIGLGLTGPPPEVLLASYRLTDEVMECDDVELSLGLGRPDRPTSLTSFLSGQPPRAVDEQPWPARSQEFWHQNFRISLNNDRDGKSCTANAIAPVRGPAPGRHWAPLPKASTTPAKRPFREANAETRTTESALRNVVHSAASLHAWNSDSSSSSSPWQRAHASFEQAHAHGDGVNSACHAFANAPRQLGGAPAPGISGFIALQPASNASMPPPSITTAGPKPSQSAHASSELEPELNGNSSKVPVVGWPPIPTYRRNSRQATPVSDRASAEFFIKSTADASTSNTADALHQTANTRNGLFVKAKLDGVRICRKVDLKACDSYSGLKVALQEMFQGLVSGSTKLDLISGKNHVLTHEDKDGDCLLVGDVPWHMFLESSVKSLRIMKAIDASGIGEKGLAKLKAQENSKP